MNEWQIILQRKEHEHSYNGIYNGWKLYFTTERQIAFTAQNGCKQTFVAGVDLDFRVLRAAVDHFVLPPRNEHDVLAVAEGRQEGRP
jgi:hypothetical protein